MGCNFITYCSCTKVPLAVSLVSYAHKKGVLVLSQSDSVCMDGQYFNVEKIL